MQLFLERIMKKRKQSEILLKNNIPKLIETYFDIVLGKEKLTEDWSDTEKDRVVKSFELVANKLPIHTPNLRATNTEQVLRLLRRGKVTITEAKELMNIMATDFEVTQLPELLERFESLQK